MQSGSISRHSGVEAHVDLDQKNSDSVFFDEKYLPNIQGLQLKKDRAQVSKPHQTRSKRRKVLKQKKLFMEISKDGKFSDKKSTLSRDERRVKRQLFIMEANRKGTNGARKPKSKQQKRGVAVNPHFDLRGRKSVKSFLQFYWREQSGQEEQPQSLQIESEEEPETGDLDLSDIEDVRVCCEKYLHEKKNGRPKRESNSRGGARPKNQSGQTGGLEMEASGHVKKGFEPGKDGVKMGAELGAKRGELAQKGGEMLEKRDFGDVFGKKADSNGEKQGKGKRGFRGDSGEKGNLGEDWMGNAQGNVVKKEFGFGMICLDMTQHFKHFPLFPPIN